MNDVDTKKIKKRIESFRRSGKLVQAIDVCKKVLSEDEGNAEFHIKLGDLYVEEHLDIRKSGQYIDEAITEYQRALESCINSASLYYKTGYAFFCKRELEKAANYFKLALEHNPKYSEAYLMLARISMIKGDFHETREYAANVIKTAPFSSSRAHFIMYSIMSLNKNFGFFQKAPHLIASFLTLPFDREAIKAVIKYFSFFKFVPQLIKAAFVVYFNGFSEKVLDIYKDIIDKAPGYSDMYVSLGRIYAELRRYDDAICEYKMAIWLDSLNIKAYYYLCLLYEERKDFENASLVCQKLIELQPHTADFRCRMAQYLYLAGKVEEAVKYYQSAVTLSNNPQWTGIVAQTLGYIYRENLKNYEAAISSYQHAYWLNPSDLEVYLDLGNAFFENGSYDNAVTVYKKALESAPYNARLHCNLGYLYWGKGNTEAAVKEYEKAIQYDNTYDIAYNNLGVIYLDDLGLVKKAIELFEAAKKYNPNYALANYNLARSIAITGNKVEAAKLYKIAEDINEYTMELDPEDIREKIKELFE